MGNLLDKTAAIQGWKSAREQYSFHPWDPPTELIQGSVRSLLDSSNTHFKTLKVLSEHLKIWISEKEKTVKILDYGSGFKDLDWLALHRSSHVQAKKIESGFGIGLTAVLAQTDRFRIVSRWSGGSDIMEATYIDVFSGLNQAIKDEEAGKKPNKSMLDSTYSKYTGKISDIPIGFHGHDNLGLAVSNSVTAAEIGIELLDSSLQGLGRSSGNASTEILVAALKKKGYTMNTDLLKLLHIGQTFVQPLITTKGKMPLDIISGYADFHSSYMHHIMKYSSKYKIPPEILIIEISKIDKVNLDEVVLEKVANEIKERGEIYTAKYGFNRYIGKEQTEKK